MSANPRQPPMNSSVTLPAEWGRRVRLRRWMETSPQASRRRSRLGCSTAVAGLARHGICSGALVPRRPRHMPRRSSRSLGCAVAARRLLPLSPLLRRFCFAHASRNRKPLRCGRSSLRSRAGWSARLRWGGGAVSATSSELKVPHPRLALRAKAGWLQASSKVIRVGDAP